MTANRPEQPQNFVNTTPDKRDDDQVNLRLDHAISDNNNFFARWSFADNIRTSPQSFPGREVEMFNEFRNLAVSDTLRIQPHDDLRVQVRVQLRQHSAPHRAVESGCARRGLARQFPGQF